MEESPLIAYQQCSGGKIRSIQPLPPREDTADAEVVCSVEQNETASRLMVWRFQSSAMSTRKKLRSTITSPYKMSQDRKNQNSIGRMSLFSQDISPTHVELPFTDSNHAIPALNENSEYESKEMMLEQPTIETESEPLELGDVLTQENYTELPNGHEDSVDSQNGNGVVQSNVGESEEKTDSYFQL